MSERVKQAIDYVNLNGQEHLVNYMKPIYLKESKILAEDILSINLKKLKGIFEDAVSEIKINSVEGSLEPLNVMVKEKEDKKTIATLKQLGLDFISKGMLGAVTMAGGKGTRLGFDGPKGTFMLPFNPEKSLFQIQADGLMAVSKEASRIIPWFIMTSNDNHDESINFFEDNQYFGYDKTKVHFFPQNEMPAVDINGHLLVKGHRIVKAADGNGGIFSSIHESGNLELMDEYGIKKVFICGIDNAFIKMVDPVFIGYSIQEEKEITSKSVLKRSYDEKAGVFCKSNKRPAYIEYTEISEKNAKLTDEDGNYVFGDIGIVAYVYDISLLKKMADKPLPYHVAHKKVSYTTTEGVDVEPEKENAIKFESFIFDSFEYANDVAVMRSNREIEFAPIKNKTGEDSPEELKKRMINV